MSKLILDVGELKKVLSFEPHEAQQAILLGQEKHQYTVVECGRKLGKSLVVAYIAIKQSWLKKQRIWIVAPNYSLTEAMRQYLDPWCELLGFKFEEKKGRIVNPFTKSTIEFKTADNPKALLGMDVHLAILDEAVEIPEEVWTQRIEPNLAATNGKAIFLSTPLSEEDYFNRYYKKGQDPRQESWCSFRFPTSANPHISKKFLAEKKASLPRGVWESQYMAIPQSSYGLTFRGIDNIVAPWISQAPQPGFIDRYITGWDIASSYDFSGLMTFDRLNREVIKVEDPFHGSLYGPEGQLNKVIKHCRENNSTRIFIDSAGKLLLTYSFV